MTMAAWAATHEVTSLRWAWVAIVLAVGFFGGTGLRAGRSLRGTTLVAPWRWACVSFAVLAGGELLLACLAVDGSSSWTAHVRYLAGATTLAPFVALLGAKRPQDRAWQWIVLALLLLMALPSVKAILFDAGAPPAPHTAWRLLVAIALASQLANYLPTRFWSSALLTGLAQLGWLVGYLPSVARPPGGQLPLAGMALATAAIWLARRPPPHVRLFRRPIDRVWLDFRDAYGALWALRVAERFNASAAMHGWPMRLGWEGLREEAGVRSQEPAGKGVRSQESGAGQQEAGRRQEVRIEAVGTGQAETNAPRPDDEAAVTAAMQQNLKTLLWRFVSPEWIDERLD
jgi:hypothetical protein